MLALFGVVKHVANIFPTQNVLVLYLAMGWFSLIYMLLVLFHVYSGYVVAKLDIFWSIFWITAGGCIYSAGTLFWKLDGILPFAHAYWHIAVAIAASMHMYAVNKYLMILE
jgi:channel protein (hemolysin III family)